jgi:hypothetical protein
MPLLGMLLGYATDRARGHSVPMAGVAGLWASPGSGERVVLSTLGGDRAMTSSTYPVRVDAHLDSGLSRWLWLVKWL